MKPDKNRKIQINWPEWHRIVNRAFVPLVNNRDRYLICYGGRGSGKSDFVAKKLIFRCLTESYFRCLLIRKNYSDIKDSNYDQLKETIFDLGLQDLFEFKLQPLEIHCVNGNRFIARGLDDNRKLRSIKDVSATWVEEDLTTEDDFITITTGIRTTKADYLQEIYTINPEVEGNYQDHWFYRRFFSGHENEKAFSTRRKVELNGRVAEITATVHHSTYRDNRWLPLEFSAFLEDMAKTNPYYHQVFGEGNWGNRQLGGLAYKKFVRSASCDRALAYDPDLPLHVSFDFNTKPYMSMLILQLDNKSVRAIDSIAGRSPDNSTMATCREFVRRYPSHNRGLFIYGDPSGRNEDTKMQQGYNNFTIIEKELERYHPELRVAAKHPPVAMRLNFLNTVFETSYKDIVVRINDERCPEFVTDLMFQKENSDGTKLKEKVSRNGDTYEKYGHFSDAYDYFMCECFADEFDEYQNGPRIYVRHTEPSTANWNAKWSY